MDRLRNQHTNQIENQNEDLTAFLPNRVLFSLLPSFWCKICAFRPRWQWHSEKKWKVLSSSLDLFTNVSGDAIKEMSWQRPPKLHFSPSMYRQTCTPQFVFVCTIKHKEFVKNYISTQKLMERGKCRLTVIGGNKTISTGNENRAADNSSTEWTNDEIHTASQPTTNQ